MQRSFWNQKMIRWTRSSSSTSPWQNWLRQAAQNVSVSMSNLRKILISDFKHKFCVHNFSAAAARNKGVSSVSGYSTKMRTLFRGSSLGFHICAAIRKKRQQRKTSFHSRSDRLCEAIFIANCDTEVIERVTKNDNTLSPGCEGHFPHLFLVGFRHIFAVF